MKKDKQSNSAKAGKKFKKFTKYLIIFAIIYFLGRILASVILGI